MELGDSTSNFAAIYFDFNPPIITNIATTTVVETLGIADVSLDQMVIYPNPAHDILTILSPQGYH